MKKLKYFDTFVFESQEVLNVDVRPINALEREVLKKFKEVVRLVWEYNGSGDFEKFKKELTPYLNYPFAIHMKKFLDDVSKFKSEKGEAESKGGDLLTRHAAVYDKVLKDFKAGKVSSEVGTLSNLNSEMAKVYISTEAVAKEKFYNPFKISYASGFFGGREGKISGFEKEDLKKFLDTNLDGELYTYLNFPKDKLSSFEDLLYFMRELTTSPKPKRVDKKMIKTYSEYFNDGNIKYRKFIAMVDSYLYNNKRELIEELLNDMKEYPELVKANEKAKKKYKTLYRGLGFYDDRKHGDKDAEGPPTKNEVIKGEKENKYVATSQHEHVAKNFAYMKGHLDRDRRSDVGYIIEYEVGPEDVVLDATIFGSPYGEGEVLIDATKAKIKSIRKV